MCGFQAPYFCQSSYIISLGGPTFFLYVQKEKLDLQKRKLYISTEMLNYKCHRGWGFNLVSHRSDIFTGAFLWEGRKPSMAEKPSNQPLSHCCSKQAGGSAWKRLEQCSPCYQAKSHGGQTNSAAQVATLPF